MSWSNMRIIEFVLDHQDTLAPGRIALAHPGIPVPAHAQVYFGGQGCRNNRTLAEWDRQTRANALNALGVRICSACRLRFVAEPRYKLPAKVLEHNRRLMGSGVTVTDIRAADVERMEFQLALRRRGISDQAVLRAMDEVPREHFVAAELVDSAYADQALPIACGQTISQPYVVAYMTEQLEVEPQHHVLEVGTGSGYQAAVLVAAGARRGQHRALPDARRHGARAPQDPGLHQCHRHCRRWICRRSGARRRSTASS